MSTHETESSLHALGLEAAVESWCKLHDPTEAAKLTSYREGRLSERLSLEAVTGSKSGLVAGLTLGGNNKGRALEAGNDLIKLVDANAPQSKTLDAFRKAPLNGIATIMQMSRSAAGYNPAKIAEPGMDDTAVQEQNRLAYNAYLNNLTDCPLVDIAYSDALRLHEASQDFNKLVDSMAEAFEGVIKEDYNAIKQSLIKLAKAALSWQTVKQKQYVFSQSVVSSSEKGRSKEYTIQIMASSVAMVADTYKGATTTQTDFDVYNTRLTFQGSMWPDFSDQFYQNKVTRISDWATSMNTPAKEGFNKKTCFDKP